MQEQGINYFFEMIKWVFTDFLIKVTVLNIPIIYFLVAISLIGLIISGVLNTAKGAYNNVRSSKHRKEKNPDD